MFGALCVQIYAKGMDVIMRYLYTINGQQFDVDIQPAGSGGLGAGTPCVLAADLAAMSAAGANEEILAQTNGNVDSVRVSVGQTVSPGEILVLVTGEEGRADVSANRSGLVKQILVKKGAAVESGDVLVVLN